MTYNWLVNHFVIVQANYKPCAKNPIITFNIYLKSCVLCTNDVFVPVNIADIIYAVNKGRWE